MSLKRLLVLVLAAALLLMVASWILFNSGGTEPGDGEGDRIEQPASP